MQDTGHSFSAYFKRATSPLVVLALLKERLHSVSRPVLSQHSDSDAGVCVALSRKI